MRRATSGNRSYSGYQSDLTGHAATQMVARGISDAALEAVLNYGRLCYARGAAIYALGRKEVQRFARQGIDLRAYEGIQVVCNRGGPILTVYRNQNFRSLRPARRRYKSVFAE